ncbi:MAG TPA: DUF1801 domain-containing protein [Burkholderiaceae bacterium]|jgi:hypothetical protein
MRSLVKSAALVEAWFDMLPANQRALARELQAAVLASAPQLARTVKWGNLLFLNHGVNAIAIAVHRNHANLQFFDGAALAERFPELEGSGERVRHLRLPYQQPVDAEQVRALVRAAVGEG